MIVYENYIVMFWEQDVAGSNPVSPTTLFLGKAPFFARATGRENGGI